MYFIIDETGEKREVTYYDKNGVDWAGDIVLDSGCNPELIHSMDDDGCFHAPLDVAEFWEEYFFNLKNDEYELDCLVEQYGETAREIFLSESDRLYMEYEDSHMIMQEILELIRERLSVHE